MTVTQLFTQINAAYRGTDDDAPTTGVDFTLWLATANRKQSEWSGDGTNQWQSLFNSTAITPTFTAGLQSYNLGAQLVLPSDRIPITNGANTYYYQLVKPQERDRYTNACYISGANPQILTFVDPVLSTDPAVGGTIYVPGYYAPVDLTTGASVVTVDDPYWLVYAVASELAYNDITYRDKSSGLNNKANNLWKGMTINNRKGTSNNPRTARTQVNRITDPKNEAGVGSI